MVEDHRMNLIAHLEDLRKRLIITIIAFVVFFIGSFIYIQDIYAWFVKDLDIKLAVISPTEILWVYFMLATVCAIAGTIPVLAFQTWLFVKPALKPIERKITLIYIPALFLLFVMGLSFGYFVILPIVFQFLISLNGDMLETLFTTEKYFKFVMRLTIPFAVIFELPVVVMFLTSLGIIDPFKMTKARKYAYFILVVISVIISPPDFLSDVLVIIPLLLIYEFSIMVSRVVYRKKKQENVISDGEKEKQKDEAV